MIPSLLERDNVLVSNTAITNGATNFSYLDCKDAHYATIRVLLAAGTGETVVTAVGATVTITESDVTNSTTFVALQTDAVSALGPTKNTCLCRFDFDRRGQKRYLGVSVSPATAGGTNETFTFTALGTLSRLDNSPATTSDLVTGTNDLAFIG
jgi:hypothetical protein